MLPAVCLQLVMGGRYYSISPDEYIFAALNIYLVSNTRHSCRLQAGVTCMHITCIPLHCLAACSMYRLAHRHTIMTCGVNGAPVLGGCTCLAEHTVVACHRGALDKAASFVVAPVQDIINMFIWMLSLIGLASSSN